MANGYFKTYLKRIHSKYFKYQTVIIFVSKCIAIFCLFEQFDMKFNIKESVCMMDKKRYSF